MRLRLAAIVESSDDAIIGMDLNGIITSWNEAAHRMFGYIAEEILGRPILRIIPEELHPEEAEILRKLSAGERIEHYETTRLAKSGKKLEVSLTIFVRQRQPWPRDWNLKDCPRYLASETDGAPSAAV